MTIDFSGVHSALITPFDDSGAVDTGALIELIAYQKMSGIHGVVMAGTTGEAPALNVDERVMLVRCAKEHCSSSMKVIAGAGASSTADAIMLQERMQDAGADATLQVTPYYNKPTQDGLYAHFCELSRIASVPIILYNNPGRTGVEMSSETIARLASDCNNIVGIKEANPSTEKLIATMAKVNEVRKDFYFLAGEDSSLLPFLTLGGHGAISTSAQVICKEMIALYNAQKNGDAIYAQKIAQKINGFFSLMFSHSNPIPVKTLLAATGRIHKKWRLPLCELGADDENALLDACMELSFLQPPNLRLCQE